MSNFDLLLRGGTVIDGTMFPRYRADVLIKDGVIAKIGPDLTAYPATRVLDVTGLIVAPGAIDLHTHFDAQVHWDPYCTPYSWHGVTSALITNCGFGYAPVKPDFRERTMAMMESTEQVPIAAQRNALDWSWQTFPEWIQHLSNVPKAMNFAYFIPLNQLMIYVMGIDAAKERRATSDEMAKMKTMLHEAMDCGASGFSFSRLLNTSNHTDHDGTPMPADIHPEEDFYELASVLKERGEGIIQITANVPGTDTRDVVEKVARASGRPVLHLLCGPYETMPDFHTEMLDWVDRLAREGVRVFTTITPPNSWMEFTLKEFNFWERVPYFQRFVNASVDEKIRLASDAAFVAGARDHYDPAILGGSGGRWEKYELVRANSAKYAGDEGATLGLIATRNGLDVVELIFDILSQSKLEAEFRSIPYVGDPDKYRPVLSHPQTVVNASDGGAHIQTLTTNWTSEYLQWAVKENNLRSLEEIHYKFSALPARILELKNRGVLLEGYAADLMVYDPDNLGYVREYAQVEDLPGGGQRRVTPAPTGMRWLIVNGEIVLDAGRPVGPLPGLMVTGVGAEANTLATAH